MIMNLKLKTKIHIIILCVFACNSTYSQGLFNNQSTTSEGSSTLNHGISLLKDPNDIESGDNIFNGLGDAVGKESTPVGEGLVILSLLSGGYFILKRNKNMQKEHEV
jgi:hypothetical protein